MKTIAGIPWILLLIRLGLLLLIPVMLTAAAPEGIDSGIAVWWAGIMLIAFCIVHWRDWRISVERGVTIVLVGAIISLVLCVGAWALGWAVAGSDRAFFTLAYPTESDDFNVIVLVGYIAVAVGHALLETWLIRRAA